MPPCTHPLPTWCPRRGGPAQPPPPGGPVGMRGGLGGVWRGGTGSPNQSPPLTCPGASWLLQGKGEGVTVGTPGPLNLPGQLQAPTAPPNPHCSPNSHRTPDLPRAPQTPLNPPELLHLGSVPKRSRCPQPSEQQNSKPGREGHPQLPQDPKKIPQHFCTLLQELPKPSRSSQCHPNVPQSTPRNSPGAQPGPPKFPPLPPGPPAEVTVGSVSPSPGCCPISAPTLGPSPPSVPPPPQSVTTFAGDCRRCHWVPKVALVAPAAPCRWPEDPPAGGPCGNKGV